MAFLGLTCTGARRFLIRRYSVAVAQQGSRPDSDVIREIPVEAQRVVKAAVLGLPNSGKSTLINTLIGKKVLAVSPKVHTTMRRAVAVFTEGVHQVIVLDTPGIVDHGYARKLKMAKNFVTDSIRSIEEADLILVVNDVSRKKLRDIVDPSIIKALYTHPTIPAMLVLNKVDTLVNKEILLELAATMMDMPVPHGLQCEPRRFEEVLMTSALTGDGVDMVKTLVFGHSRPVPWEYSNQTALDGNIEDLITDTIREKLLMYLEKELPYIINQTSVICEWDEESRVLTVFRNLDCKKKSQMPIVIGPKGKIIQNIISEAQSDLEDVLQCTVDLTLIVRHKP